MSSETGSIETAFQSLSMDGTVVPKKSTFVSLGSANKKVNINEVAQVSIGSATVTLDDVFLEKLNKEDADVTGVTTITSTMDVKNSVTDIPEVICRAAVFARIVSLTQGVSAVRCKVIQFLVDMLNDGIVPVFTSEADASKELIAVIIAQKNAFCYRHSVISNACDAIAQPVKLTQQETDTLLSGQFFTTGACSLLTLGFSSILCMVDTVAALSCESYGANTEPFNTVNFESSRPHRGQINSAGNLRMLLEASARTNTCPSTVTNDQRAAKAFHNIPQIHGPVNDIMAHSIKSIELELNSCESGPRNNLNVASMGFDPTQSIVIVQNLLNSFMPVLSLSRDRIAVLTEASFKEPAVPLIAAGGCVHFGHVYKELEGIKDCLCEEIYTSNMVLDGLEQALLEARSREEEEANAQKTLNKDDIDGSTAAVDSASLKGKKQQVDDSNLTPEQRIKAEAKRKAKADAAAAKKAAKEAKKGVNKAITYGTGTSQFRKYIMDKCNDSKVNRDSVASIVNLYDTKEGSVAYFCSNLIAQLFAGGDRRKPRIAKGARDFTPDQMRIRDQVFSTIKRVFKRHGGVEIDTPVFELKDVLTGKYGEDSKLIFDLADQGEDILALRYDLTVPFARFLALNSVGNIKRYHIAKVYRRDEPQVKRGRYREFYQCDFDIAGSYTPMVPDAEVITVATEILSELPIGPFLVKLNHRRLLDAIFEISGVPADKFRPICSAVDKLDKVSWEDVRKEMIEEKELPAVVADRIGEFVLNSGSPRDLWTKLSSSKIFGDHEGAASAMSDLNMLFDYLTAMGSIDYISFDLSLARGLDYYTGVIYEIVLTDGASQVGSISAGGRYDNLVGMFSVSGIQTPCVGVSIGVERVFTIIEQKAHAMNVLQASTIQVYIASIGSGLIPERMKIAKVLWQANFATEYSTKENPKLKPQMDEVLERCIPYMVVFGKDELVKGTVKIKNMIAHTEEEVAITALANYLLEQGCKPIEAGDVGLLAKMDSK